MQIHIQLAKILNNQQLTQLEEGATVEEVLSRMPWDKLINTPYAKYCNWESITDVGWTSLLAKYPQFADKCNWQKFKGNTWVMLLSNSPQFADKCDWSKLNEDDFKSLLNKQPQFAIHKK